MIKLEEFSAFVNEILLNNSRNYKIDILNKYKDNESIQAYLNYVYNPYLVYGISDKKLNKSVTCLPDTVWLDPADLSELLEYLSTHNTGRDSDIQTAKNFLLTHVSTDLLPLAEKIITKNLQLGITATTINKVFNNLIPDFKVQLANKYFDNPKIVDDKEFAITTKIDGMRCVVIKEGDSISFWSRQGQQIIGLADLESELKNIADDFVLDGELVAICDSPDTYKQTMQLARTDDLEKHGLQMLVFDCMLPEEFKSQKCARKYLERRTMAEKFVANKIYFTILPMLYCGNDASKIETILYEQVSDGQEGIMLNMLDAGYDFKRTNNLLKVKLMQSYDLEIIGFEEGENKFSGTLGSLLLRYKNGNVVKCGSGIPDKLHFEIWDNQEKYLGRIVEVKYFEETTNANGGESLRFPIFKGFREEFDKNTPDF